jgi:predicted small metal-binding protein
VSGRKKTLTCDCGFAVHADNEQDLVARVQRHALDAHGMPISPQQVRQLAARAEAAKSDRGDRRR